MIDLNPGKQDNTQKSVGRSNDQKAGKSDHRNVLYLLDEDDRPNTDIDEMMLQSSQVETRNEHVDTPHALRNFDDSSWKSFLNSSLTQLKTLNDNLISNIYQDDDFQEISLVDERKASKPETMPKPESILKDLKKANGIKKINLKEGIKFKKIYVGFQKWYNQQKSVPHIQDGPKVEGKVKTVPSVKAISPIVENAVRPDRRSISGFVPPNLTNLSTDSSFYERKPGLRRTTEVSDIHNRIAHRIKSLPSWKLTNIYQKKAFEVDESQWRLTEIKNNETPLVNSPVNPLYYAVDTSSPNETSELKSLESASSKKSKEELIKVQKHESPIKETKKPSFWKQLSRKLQL